MQFNLNKLTIKAQESFQNAIEIARQHQELEMQKKLAEASTVNAKGCLNPPNHPQQARQTPAARDSQIIFFCNKFINFNNLS